MLKNKPYIQELFATFAVAILISSAGMGTIATETAKAQADCTEENTAVFTLKFVNKPSESVLNCALKFYNDGYSDASNESLNNAQVTWQESARNSKSNQEIYNDTQSNYDNAIRSRARVLAMETFYEKVENGFSKSAALTAVNQTISDYYTAQYIQIMNMWNEQVLHFYGLQGSMDNQPNASWGNYWSVPDGDEIGTSYEGMTRGDDTQTFTATAPNGTGVDMHGIGIQYSSNEYFVTPTGVWYPGNSDPNYKNYLTLRKDTQNSDLSAFNYVNAQPYQDSITELESQNDEVQADMKQVVDGTYDEISAENINSTDFAKVPSLADRWDPNSNFSAWSYSTVLSLGGNLPENLSGMGSMEVNVSGGPTHTGILATTGTFPNGTLKIGKTYNTTNLEGDQMVLTDTGIKKLPDKTNFTIESATDRSGDDLNDTSIDYSNMDYTTTNTTEAENLYDEIQRLQEEINKTQATLGGGGSEDSNSGGSIPDWLNKKYGPIPLWGWIGIVTIVGYFVSNRNSY